MPFVSCWTLLRNSSISSEAAGAGPGTRSLCRSLNGLTPAKAWFKRRIDAAARSLASRTAFCSLGGRAGGCSSSTNNTEPWWTTAGNLGDSNRSAREGSEGGSGSGGENGASSSTSCTCEGRSGASSSRSSYLILCFSGAPRGDKSVTGLRFSRNCANLFSLSRCRFSSSNRSRSFSSSWRFCSRNGTSSS